MRRHTAGVVVLTLALTASSAFAQGESRSTVIRNVIVMDGTGAPGKPGAVRITGDKIVEVGQLRPRGNDVVIEGGGLVLAPGFIDSHSHHDADIGDRRDVVAAMSQGITTIVVGQDGSSRVPLSAFFSGLEAKPAAVNVGSYSGHNTLRDIAMQGADKRRPANAVQVAKMSELLTEDMKAGALGLSTGLGYESGIHSDLAEVVQLTQTAASHGGRYISHIRNENVRVVESVEEAIEIGRQTRAPVQISHIKISLQKAWGQGGDLVRRLQQARADGLQVTADVYPYTYWQTTMRILFDGGSLDDRERIEKAFAQTVSPAMLYVQRYEPDKSVEGKTIEALARARGQDPVSLYIALAKQAAAYQAAKGLSSPEVESVIGTGMSEQDIETFLRWEHTNICSDGSHGGHPRGHGAFTRVLGRYVRERGVLTWEQAIHKMTGLTVRNLGIAGRGVIAPGKHADLVLLDPKTVADRATMDAPTARSVGIEKVWVNGQVVYERGEPTSQYPGVVVRASGGAR